MHAIVNVRLGSSRLPGKVLKPFGNVTALDILHSRISLSGMVNEIIVNTSVNPIDDAIIEHCERRNYSFHRGSEDDVLARTVSACDAYDIDNFVEVYGDCPLIDFRIIDRAIKIFEQGEWDFVGNDLKTTYPPGFEVEIVNAAALRHSADECTDPDIREHGTLYIRLNKSKYNVMNFEYERQLESIPHLTLDTPEDYELITKVYQICFEQHGPGFSVENILDLFDERPDLMDLNSNVARKWSQYRE